MKKLFTWINLILLFELSRCQPDQLSQILAMLGANDTETIKKGEKFLKPFLKQPMSVEHVLKQLELNTEPR